MPISVYWRQDCSAKRFKFQITLYYTPFLFSANCCHIHYEMSTVLWQSSHIFFIFFCICNLRIVTHLVNFQLPSPLRPHGHQGTQSPSWGKQSKKILCFLGPCPPPPHLGTLRTPKVTCRRKRLLNINFGSLGSRWLKTSILSLSLIHIVLLSPHNHQSINNHHQSPQLKIHIIFCSSHTPTSCATRQKIQ